MHERADALARTVVNDLHDPFRVVELTGKILKEDPARLTDEANALSFSGGGRVVRLRDAVDSLSPLFKEFFALGRIEALVIVEAGSLKPQSSLRKTFEDAKNAAALACYEDGKADLRGIIVETLGNHDISIAPDALAVLIDSLGADRLMSRSELDKLALYMGGAGTVTTDDVHACIGDSSAMSLDNVVDAAFDGDRLALEHGLTRSFTEGIASVTVLRAAARHIQQLHLANALIAKGQAPGQAVKSLRPPVFFKRESRFTGHLRIWTNKKLAAALDLVTEAELDCKTSGQPDKAICGRTLLRIAQAAHHA